jgi:ectoine hydroxylase-related dioxygenase (phytanoyl-CoA dioxygenase family)
MEQHLNFDTVADYAKAELAATHKSSAGSQPPADPARIDTALERLRAGGYVVFENLLSKAKVTEIRETVTALFAHGRGRNNFEGFRTQRLYSVIDKTLICNELIEHPLILALLDRLFLPNYLLSQLQAINILPGEEQQPIHCDDGFYRVPRPRPPLGAATIWAIDDFSAENGATVVIPGSHLWDDHAPDERETRRQLPVIMPAGSVVFFLGTLWHGGGANRSDRGRLCITAQYCEPWCRQQENFSLSIPRDQVRKCSEHIQRMLGYSICAPFMGFVNGMHPKRLLEN